MKKQIKLQSEENLLTKKELNKLTSIMASSDFEKEFAKNDVGTYDAYINLGASLVLIETEDFETYNVIDVEDQ